MRITVTQVAGDGAVRRVTVESDRRADADRWDRLVTRANLAFPPPYQPEPGQPVYEVRAGEQTVQVAAKDLVGPLRELVAAVLAEAEDTA